MILILYNLGKQLLSWSTLLDMLINLYSPEVYHTNKRWGSWRSRSGVFLGPGCNCSEAFAVKLRNISGGWSISMVFFVRCFASHPNSFFQFSSSKRLLQFGWGEQILQMFVQMNRTLWHFMLLSMSDGIVVSDILLVGNVQKIPRFINSPMLHGINQKSYASMLETLFSIPQSQNEK